MNDILEVKIGRSEFRHSIFWEGFDMLIAIDHGGIGLTLVRVRNLALLVKRRIVQMSKHQLECILHHWLGENRADRATWTMMGYVKQIVKGGLTAKTRHRTGFGYGTWGYSELVTKSRYAFTEENSLGEKRGNRQIEIEPLEIHRVGFRRTHEIVFLASHMPQRSIYLIRKNLWLKSPDISYLHLVAKTPSLCSTTPTILPSPRSGG